MSASAPVDTDETRVASPERPAKQLRLFAAPQPLVERLGVAFFRALPRTPGVYLMRDAEGHLLYVGKAGNLRQRLNSYRSLTHASRKTVRLVHQVRTIDWELLPSEPAARLRENELLRIHRPRFNRVNTWPRVNCFARVHGLADGIQLSISRDPLDEARVKTDSHRGDPAEFFPERLGSEPSGWVYGAFKPAAAWALAALLRLLWLALDGAFHDLPRSLLTPRLKPSGSIRHAEAGDWLGAIRSFLSGESDELVARLSSCLPTEPVATFQERLQAADLETLTVFFERGPRRNRIHCERLGRAEMLVSQEELDDLSISAP